MQIDAISRSAALEVLSYDLDRTAEDINKLPALDVAPVVHAKWIHCKGKTTLWYCSECGDKMKYDPRRRTYNITKKSMAEKNRFCRNCGARMDKGENE